MIGKVAVLIPARQGSKRVVGKNIRMLGRYPLMVWSIMTGLELGETYVSTDSVEYGDIAVKYGSKVVYRDAADDNQGDIEVCAQFIKHVDTDIIVYLRPTTPFRSINMVKAAIEQFQGSGLRSVELMGESAYKCFEIDGGRLVPIPKFMTGDMTDWPNHKCPETYHPNGYVDIVRVKHVKDGTLWGPEKQAWVTPRTIEIDTEEDFEYAEYWVQRNPAVRYSFGKKEHV